PARARQVAAHNALDRHHLGLADQHGAAAQFLRPVGEGRPQGGDVGAEQVVADAEEVEPEQRQGGQDAALIGDRGGQDPVEGGEGGGGGAVGDVAGGGGEAGDRARERGGHGGPPCRQCKTGGKKKRAGTDGPGSPKLHQPLGGGFRLGSIGGGAGAPVGRPPV